MRAQFGLPRVVLMVPVAFVVRRVIRQAFGSLEEAATAIEAARGHERGSRIDTSHLPADALPFTDAVHDLLGRLDDAPMRQEAFAAAVRTEEQRVGNVCVGTCRFRCAT